MEQESLTNYDNEAKNFAELPEYSIDCGTDYLAVKDVPDKIRQLKSAHNILDLGCGSGLATRFIKKHFPNAVVVGADINKNMLTQAVNADSSGLYLHLQQSNNEVIYPFIKNSFDVVICSFVVHENRTIENLKTFLRNVANILRPGGLFLAWDVHHNLFNGEWLSIKNMNSSVIKEGDPYTVKILPAHAEVTGTYWSPETLTQILESCGLQSHTTYPVMEENTSTSWLDETRMAPYFLLEAKKQS